MDCGHHGFLMEKSFIQGTSRTEKEMGFLLIGMIMDRRIVKEVLRMVRNSVNGHIIMKMVQSRNNYV